MKFIEDVGERQIGITEKLFGKKFLRLFKNFQNTHYVKRAINWDLWVRTNKK